MTPKEHAERAIRAAYHLADDEPLPEYLLALRQAIVEELWAFLMAHTTPVAEPPQEVAPSA